jgi:hypothetical protein
MSSLPLSPWNNLCWKDHNISFNFEELINIYNTVYSKYTRHEQEKKEGESNPNYRGIAFQGLHNNDHLNSVMQGSLYLTNHATYAKTYSKEMLGNHLENQKKFNVRHKDLCVGEFNKILDYLEDLGWHTHRGRIMELGPGAQKNWHVDSYPGMWNNNVRYHVPLTTNERCYLQWYEQGKIYNFTPEPNGSGYWVNTDITHQYLNIGDSWRAHIIVDLIKK